MPEKWIGRRILGKRLKKYFKADWVGVHKAEVNRLRSQRYRDRQKGKISVLPALRASARLAGREIPQLTEAQAKIVKAKQDKAAREARKYAAKLAGGGGTQQFPQPVPEPPKVGP